MTTALRIPLGIPCLFRAARKDLAIPPTPLSDELGCAIFMKDRQSSMARKRKIIDASCGRNLQ